MADNKQTLGDRMKEHEAKIDIIRIKPYNHFIVRLDGRAFSKFCTGLKKPFDENFIKAMTNTMNDLVEEFSAITGYCHSDEISLVFPRLYSIEEYNQKCNANLDIPVHMFGGRLQKICSVIASYASVRFNHHLKFYILGRDNFDTVNSNNNVVNSNIDVNSDINVNNLNSNLNLNLNANSNIDVNSKSDVNSNIQDITLQNNSYSQVFLKKILNPYACFDARIVELKDSNEVVNLILWRSTYDCYRNAVMTYARSYFSHKQLNNKSTKEAIEMMKSKGFDWNTQVPLHHKYGTYAKRELYQIPIPPNVKFTSKTKSKAISDTTSSTSDTTSSTSDTTSSTSDTTSSTSSTSDTTSSTSDTTLDNKFTTRSRIVNSHFKIECNDYYIAFVFSKFA